MGLKKARVASFYGWTDEYIRSMPYEDFIVYSKCCHMLMNSDMLSNIHAISYPHLKTKKDREGLIRSLKNESKKYISSDKSTTFGEVMKDLKRKAMGLMNG